MPLAAPKLCNTVVSMSKIEQEKPYSGRTQADFAIEGATIITMDGERRVISQGTVGVSGSRICAVGPGTADSLGLEVDRIIDGGRFVIAPGLINAHVHTTGDPLTRHYMPDYLADKDKLQKWVMPRYFAHEESDENLSAKLCSIELLKSGTTTFIEAGTIRHLDAAIEGVQETGIRARVGKWVEGRAFDESSNQTALIDQAIADLESQQKKYPQDKGTVVAAWPILVGHTTNPDEVWTAAKSLADSNGVCVAAHMSPYASDPEWFLSETGRRPANHLEHIGALGSNVVLTHATHLDEGECSAIARTGTHIAFCPFASLKGAFGVYSAGKYTELIQRGVRVLLATDGYESDLLPAARLATSLYKDIEGDVTVSSSLKTLEHLTIKAAEALGLQDDIGSLEVGKCADFICFDTNHLQWRPLLSPVDQLIWSADARSLHSVWVNGERVLEAGVSSRVDEDEMLAAAQEAGESIIRRSNLPYERSWKAV